MYSFRARWQMCQWWFLMSDRMIASMVPICHPRIRALIVWFCSSLTKKAESVSLLLKPRLVLWFALADKVDDGAASSEPRPQEALHAFAIPLLSCHLHEIMPGLDMVEDERHVEQSRVTPVTPSEANLEKPIDGQRGASCMALSRLQLCLPASKWPQVHGQQTYIIVGPWVFVAVC